MRKESRIYVAGSDALIGMALTRQLQQQGYDRVVGIANTEPDLHDGAEVDQFFAEETPEYVFLAAGRSGGIAANQRYPAELMLDNLLSAAHIIESAHKYRVTKLVYLASSCTYPRQAAQPMQPDALMTGVLEPTNESYAVAKLAGIKLCEAYRKQYGDNFITAIPANPFGVGDDFNPEDSHVIGALMRRMHEAKRKGDRSVEIWGTGQARREFIFADDLAAACIYAMQHYEGAEPLNMGSGEDFSISELAQLIKEVVRYKGSLHFDTSKPDGMPIKILDSTPLLGIGWKPQVLFRDALQATYNSFLRVLREDKLFHV